MTTLADAIRTYVRRGPEAVSYIHRSLQQDGWRGLGPLAVFTRTVRDLGFVVREGRNDRGQDRIEVDDARG